MSYETQEAKILMEELMESLSYIGIGGKKTSGLGKFIFRAGKTNAVLENLLKKETNRYMLLSGALPQDQELDTVLEKASYGLEKRSGFVSSENYADEQQKKNDLYLLKAGSCFETQFEGDIYDVGCGGSHPVYRYAKALFVGV